MCRNVQMLVCLKLWSFVNCQVKEVYREEWVSEWVKVKCKEGWKLLRAVMKSKQPVIKKDKDIV